MPVFYFKELDPPVQQAILEDASNRAKTGCEIAWELAGGDPSILADLNVEPRETKTETVRRHVQRAKDQFLNCEDRIFSCFGICRQTHH